MKNNEDFLPRVVNGRRVLILGFGQEGKSTFSRLNKTRAYAKLDVADINGVRPREAANGAHAYICGEGYLSVLDDYDIVFKSPGVALPAGFTPQRARLTSQTELFLEHFGKSCIGITGTKGKSTTAKLIYHALRENGADAALAGNIGVPVFDVLDAIGGGTAVVLELSCHQLERCAHSPHTAVLLNIFADHLDRYKTFDAYAETKKNICKHQADGDTLFCPENLAAAMPTRARIIPVDAKNAPFADFSALPAAALRGAHNVLNCAFAYEVCKGFGISENGFIRAVCKFKPLPHRLEYIGEKNGGRYYDDSISTTPECAISAVLSVENAKILLIGGLDRGVDYSPLTAFLPKSGLEHVIFMYESGLRVFNEAAALKGAETRPAPSYHYVNGLSEAAALAKKLLPPGGACVLSPAAASYGYFKDFAERGNKFAELVLGGGV